MPDELAERVHLVALPMVDPQENAAIVNALQRRADVVVQKSLAEGFGLTVAEAMWKARPVVASRIGGIQDQIADGESGLLLDDPLDLAAYGAAVRSLLDDPARAEAMGREAQERVRGRFLGTRTLLQDLELRERYSGRPEQQGRTALDGSRRRATSSSSPGPTGRNDPGPPQMRRPRQAVPP